MAVQMGRLVASKLSAHEPATFFSRVCMEIGAKVIFFVKCSLPKNLRREKFLGLALSESLRTQDSENIVGLGDQASVSKLQRLKLRS